MSDNRVATFIARIRVPLLVLAAIVLLFGIVLTQWAVSSVGFVLLLVAMALYLRIGTVRAQPIDVRPPVVGRWIPVNGPGSKVPSHGLHAWGQTYAIDLVYKPSGDYRPELVWAPLSRPADSFAGYGQPVVAPAAGTVVRVYDRARDHRSRTSWAGLAYLLVEGGLREMGGPKRLLGNHVVLDLGNGRYAAVAHLRRDSVRVRPGQHVERGDLIAECGNSGNSSEPHVHFQVMDRPHLAIAAGLPFRFTDLDTPGGLPKNGEAFVAAAVSEAVAKGKS